MPKKIKSGNANTNIDIILKIAESKLKEELQSIDQIKARVNLITAFFGILIAGIIQNGFDEKLPALIKIALTLIFFALIFALFAYKVRSFRNDPNPEKLYKKYRNYKKNYVKKLLCLNIIEAYKDNNKIIKRINGLLYISMILFVISALAIIVYFLREEVKFYLWIILRIIN